MSIKVCSVGDIMLGENVHHFRRGIATRYEKNFQNLVPPEVTRIMNQADLVVGNLECSLMPDRDHKNAPLARAAYAAPESALACFEGWRPPLVLNVANNHFAQHGSAAMEYTLDCLHKRGIYVIGRDKTPLELMINERKISLLGVSVVTDASKEGYLKSSFKNLLQDLKWGPKSDGTFRILSIHWGEEYRTLPTRIQQETAGMLAESGVDLILGHHPHVVQPVRRIDGATVAYSHGNFIFDQNFSHLTQTGLVLLTNLNNGEIYYYRINSHKYQIFSCRKFTHAELETFCYKKRTQYNPFLMRILMKIELLRNAHQVPKDVWKHFFLKLTVG